MIAKSWAGFIADFPNDQVEGDDDQMEILGGRNVAVALGKVLTGLGCDVETPYYDGLNGWVFDLRHQGKEFWCQLTSFHPAFYLLFDDAAKTRGARAKNAAVYAEIWQKFAEALAKDSRFHDVEWRSKEEGPPDPEAIGDAKSREAAARIRPAPLKASLRPEQTPQSGFGCYLMMAALLGCGFGLFWVLDAVAGFFRGEADAGIDLALGAAIFVLCALALRRLLRGPKPRRKA